jgi:hypothetical protein
VAGIHVRLLTTTSLGSGAPAIRVRLATLESVTSGSAALRTRLSTIESTTGGHNTNLRARFSGVEDVSGGQHPPKVRTRLCVVESLQAVQEEVMATVVFPGIDPATGQPAVILGLAFDVVKRPTFNNKVVEHVSGDETSTAYWENPKWDYTLTFDYLPDYPKSVGDSDLRTMMGFFLNMRGRFSTWLFKDPDDYSVTAGYQKTFDGVSTGFNLVRGMQGYYEPVGQLNTDQPYSIWLQANEDHVIPVTPGPYTVTINHAAAITAVEPVVHIGATLLTKVSSAPTINQYTRTGGVFTFNAGQQGQTTTINYQYLVDPADYTFTGPNIINFHVAPVANAIASASFEYYFVCRFKDDVTEFTKFMNQLWELTTLNFRSIPQS